MNIASLIFIINAFTGLAAAQLSIGVETNKTEVALDDQVVLAVTITGGSASLPDPQFPAASNFSVYSSGKSHSISIINGRMAATAVHTYVLVPRAVGKGVVPSITATAGSETARTAPLEIQVVPGAAQQRGPAGPAAAAQAQAQPQQAAPRQPAGPDVFVTAEVDKPRAFVNEQVTLSVKFHTAVNLLSNPEYSAPRVSGFLSEDLPPLRHLQLNSRGRSYYVTEVKTALFPLQSGKLSIGPAGVRVQVQRNMAVDPMAPDFFERFFSQGLAGGEERVLHSDGLTVAVDALPEEGKPADFSGAVGDFTLTLQADKKTAKVGEPVALTLTVSGRGNLKALGELKLPPLPSWRVYDPVPSVSLKKEGDQVRGSKALRFVAVPRVTGTLVLPAVSLSFFDPSQRKYRRVETAPLTVDAAPGEPGAAGSGVSFGGEGASKGLTTLGEDIRHLKTRPGPSGPSRLLRAFAGAGPAHGLPALLFAGFAAAAWRRRQLERDPKRARARAALKSALQKIQAGALHEALLGFLGDKFGEPGAALTQKRAAELLASRGIDAAQTRRLWSDIEASRYAPGGAAAGDLAGPLEALLRSLDKELT